MPLAPGRQLGPYEILGSAGAGGMGEVFKARDRRLDRIVAIKVLPQAIARDPTIRQRFEREARVIAGLTHPHICTLYDVGHDEGLEYLVLEYVEGETLADRLARGRLPMDLVVQTAIEIADALDRAHRAGVVHRDLKPGNVMLTRSGTKLLDFGLAKVQPVDLAPGVSSTDTAALTLEGMLVGTLHYMAPEQLEGKDVDGRADIFALGAVIHEMATGRRAFSGSTQASIIGAIMHTAPPAPSTLQPLASPALDHIVARCLEKDRELRWQSARDLMLELRSLADRSAIRGSVSHAPQPAPARTLQIFAALATLACAAALVALLVMWRRPTPTPAPIRTMIPAPTDVRFNFTGDFGGPPAITPDGRALAFVASLPSGRRQLWFRRMDTLSAQPLPGTEDATFPFWSPDGASIGFFANGRLKRVDVEGGAVLTLCDAASGRGGTWSQDGVILFAPTVEGGIFQVSATGGDPSVVVQLDTSAHASYRWPAFAPDGRSFVYLAIPQDPAHRSDTAVYAASLDAREPKLLVKATTQASFAGDLLLYLRDGTLMADRFDPGARTVAGHPAAIAQHVQYDLTIWWGVFAAGATGPLVYQAGSDGGRTVLALFDTAGVRVGTVGDPGIYFDVNISPDGRAAAVNRGDPGDIWVYDLARSISTRITSDEMNESLPIWSPDSTSLIFSSTTPDGRGVLSEARADGSDSPRAIYTGDILEASDWSPDGRFLLTKVGDLRTKPGDVWVLPLANPSQQFPFVASPFAEYHARFSPDGRWVSYVSNETGREEVYVTAFKAPSPGETADVRGRDPDRPGRWQVSTAGGMLPRWKRDGTMLYYFGSDRRLMAARVDGRGSAFHVLSVDPLFRIDPKPIGWLYDVTPDGQRFLVDTLGPSADAPLVVATEWRPAQ